MIVGTRRWPRLVALSVTALTPVLLAGCSSKDAPAPTSSPNLSAPSQAHSVPSASKQDERKAIESAYTQYWPRSAQTPHKPENTWHDAMAAIAVEPQLSTTLDAMHRNKGLGLTTYGDVTVRIASVEVVGATAKVVDCQDASHAGQADANTGKPKTVGVPRMPVHATLARDPADGQWKVSQLDFPGGAC
ncbi:hypothetical protein [Amycolatopsis sp. NPDC059021]|uniref:hypothetical protein n=1 Tax=Amycolatopsis sp. NPDC059021 TaxID=3346704 RepID=UPI00366B5F01